MTEVLDNMPQISSMGAAEYFGLLTEDAFPKAGVHYPEIAAYAAGMLTEYVRAERMFNPLWRADREAETENLIDMVKHANSQSGFLRAVAARHVGDFTMLMSGVFPDNLEARGISPDFYAFQGKNAYSAASVYYKRRMRDFGLLLSGMADYFEKCVDGLNRIRKEHFHFEQADYGRLFVPKDRNALYNLMLDAMARWKETMDARDKGVMLFYAEKLGIREDELFSRQ